MNIGEDPSEFFNSFIINQFQEYIKNEVDDDDYILVVDIHR